ncbi:hypothetical protein HK100_008810, partial [Physocladia obscura]
FPVLKEKHKQHEKLTDDTTKEKAQNVFDVLHKFSEGITDKPCYCNETILHRKVMGFFAQMLGHAVQRKIEGWLEIDPEPSGDGNEEN